MPQAPAPNMTPEQVDAVRRLLPAPGDPPAVQGQKKQELRALIETFRRGGAPLSNFAPSRPPTAAPGIFGGGQSRGAGASGDWSAAVDTAVDRAAAPPLLHAPIEQDGPTLAVSHGLGAMDKTPAASHATPAASPAPASGSLNFSDYLGGTAPAPAPAASGSLNFSDHLGGKAPAAAPRGPARPAAKAPPAPPSPTAAASVPSSYLGPDVQAQIGATFAGRAPADRLGSGPSQAAAVLARPPEGPTSPALERQAIEGLLSGTASAAPGGGPGAPPETAAPPPSAQPSSPEVAAMVDQLLAEARRGGPILDTFRRSAGRKGKRALFGGK